MTSAQTRRVCEAVLPLAREWLLERGPGSGRYGSAAAYADLDADCYIGIVNVFFAPEGKAAEQFGQLTWRLDHTFTPLGEPEYEQEENTAKRQP